MGWSKRQFVNAAFEDLGLAEYAFDLSPSDLNAAVNRLDGLLASWNAQGIMLGYPIPSNPNYADLNAATDVPDSANEAIYTNLALRLAPMFGKQASPDLRANAKAGYNAMLSRNARVYPMQLGLIPAGAGNKAIRSTFIEPAPDPLSVGESAELFTDGNNQLNGEDYR